ncbi:MAG: phosphoglycerate kinase [Deltaproteobacteria bacterium RIFCSPLOWO2_02_FULL_53_8]|nr:MAG: phosphoglycerate kinase [Deltaproteobacteria bacterium RIFCSPLOWO2_02_FULL_53_8]
MNKGLKFIDELDLKGKRVLIRVDFNVPLDDKGNITDDTRIRGVLPTINYALDQKAMVILASHLGRPKGKRVGEMSLGPVAKRLGRLLDKDVTLTPDCVGDETKKIVADMKPGDVVLLENLRFHTEEEKNDGEFGKNLGALADVYINDAFATAHRAHASNVAITKHVKEYAAGFLMKKELTYFSMAMEKPVRPLIAIIGGKKVSDKVGVLAALCDRVDKLIIGGGMAMTFFKALGYEIGKSFAEDEALAAAKEVIAIAKEKKIKLYLPVDFVVADRYAAEAETKVVTYQEIPKEWMALDIGPATVTLFSEAIQNAKTIIWNGPMGVFELDAFARGTFAMVSAVANTYAMTIVGGGDTDVAVHRAGEYAKISYISTGGGAFLEILKGKELPGITALRQPASGDLAMASN